MIEDEWDRREAEIVRAYEAEEITLAEYNKQLGDLARDFREAAREDAHNAYDRTREGWQ